jgi:sulfotransferase
MDKKFFFMAGLPRSGGTMLSSILNQNPDIYVSPQSVLPNTLGSTYNQYSSRENKDSDQWDNIYRVMEMIIPTFYGGYKEKYIIDKSFSWLEPHPYVILEHHLKNPIRVICPVRNVVDILASWNRLCENDPNNKFDPAILQKDKTKRSMADKRADYFMSIGDAENDIRKGIENMKRILHSQLKNNIMLVDYDDLILDTENTVNKVYDFLGIEHYDANLDNLSTPHTYTDHWGVKNHHKVKKTVQRENYVLEDIFSPSIIKKYSGLEFWKDM